MLLIKRLTQNRIDFITSIFDSAIEEIETQNLSRLKKQTHNDENTESQRN